MLFSRFLTQKSVNLILALVHLLNDRIVGIGNQLQTGKKKLIDRHRLMILRVGFHYIDHIGIVLIADRDETVLLYHESHRNGLIVVLLCR